MRLISLVGLMLANFALAQQEVHDLGLHSPYLSNQMSLYNYDYGGSAMISKHGVGLTSDVQDQRGWIVSKPGRSLPENFEISLNFTIEGEARNMYADGMALFFLDPTEAITEGPVMGFHDQFKGTAVLIDTYRNHRPGKLFPYIMLMQNDGTQTYDKDNDGAANELASCSARGLHNSRTGPSGLKLKYHNEELTVSVNHRGSWEKCFSEQLPIKSGSRLALTASTGQLTEAHTILDLLVEKLDRSTQPPVRSQNSGPRQRHQKKKRGGWLWFIFKWTFIGAAAFGCYKAWTVYKENQRRNTDPFKYL